MKFSIPACVLLFLSLLGCGGPEALDSLAPLQQDTPPSVLGATPTYSGPPIRIPLTVRETAGVGRAGEVLRSGVPLPRSLGVRDVRILAVVDAQGRAVPAEFVVLARWNAGKDDAAAPIQWLLVAFPATVAAGKSAAYTLVAGEGNPAPPAPLKLTRQGGHVVVDTGAAVFRLGGSGALFDEIRLPGAAKPLVSGGEMTARANGADGRHATVRGLRIEHAGPLSAVVVVDGAYDLPAVGGGGFGTRRRYVFTAGSPTAVVRHAVAWEGNLGCQGCDKTGKGAPNGVLIERVRDALALESPPTSVLAVGDFKGAPLEKTLGEEDASRTAWVRQRLRPQREAPLRFEVHVAGVAGEGKKADGGMLAVSGAAGTVAAALNHMHRYEPQALRLLPGGRLAVDLVDDKAWLAHHQGLFATFAITALPAAPKRADLDRLLWAPLNRPLRAWPDAAWFNSSQAVSEIPAGPLPKKLAAYDELIGAVLDRTVAAVDSVGLNGLMTFGVYPRYWSDKGPPGEVRCTDPTPKEAWDELFWCGAWTDYHNTVATAQARAMRTGEVEWLDELSFPGALRTLHTQIMQCGPEESWFYCGQAPTGYGAYRTDFNSSHAYFENLFLYYWLTGDSTVVDVVQRGGDSMRRLMCGTRGPGPVTQPKGPGGPACAATHPPDNNSSNFTGRVASQWLNAFRFLGLASGDPSFLEDYRLGLARAVTQHYAEVERGGKRYGFLGDRVKGPGTYEAGPWWTTGFYDSENLHRLEVDTQDAPIGEPSLAPSHVLAALARTVVEIGSRQFGDGTPRGTWPRLLVYTWSGPRIGGALTEVKPKDRELYNTEKAGMVASIVRAGRQTGEPALIEAGDELIQFVLGDQRGGRGEVVPLGKIQGQNLTRLHAAVAVAATPPAVPAGSSPR
jgi:hypothetical protein